MFKEEKSYPPAENLDKIVEGLNRLLEVPFPTYFKNISGKPENWPKELLQIYKTDREFFDFVKKTLPNLTYDELNFLKNDLKLIEEKDLQLEDFIRIIDSLKVDGPLLKKFKHMIHIITPLNRPFLRCYVLNSDGQELIKYYRNEDMPNFYHALFLKFLFLEPPFFAQVLQDPITLNMGRSIRPKTSAEVEKAFDRIIKPSYAGRHETSTESRNIRRWLQYFRLLIEFEQNFVFNLRQLKVLLVGTICHFLNRKFKQEGYALKWANIRNELENIVHINPNIIDIEELVELIIEENESSVRWIPSERGDLEFRGHKGKQILELQKELIPPKPQNIEISDFLKVPSIPKIENIELIKTSKLDELWR
ncbi:MAG: hypothetical protein QXF61_05650 [Nitrososphaeria archaeon]